MNTFDPVGGASISAAQQHYRVGQVASLMDVSILTLHYYDEIGLLHPSSGWTRGGGSIQQRIC